MAGTRYEAGGQRRCGKDLAADMAIWVMETAEDNSAEHERLKKNLMMALREEVTEKQREYLLLYYGQGLKMEEIGALCGVDRSTVSQTIKRGQARLRRCLRYGAARLLEPEA